MRWGSAALIEDALRLKSRDVALGAPGPSSRCGASWRCSGNEAFRAARRRSTWAARRAGRRVFRGCGPGAAATRGCSPKRDPPATWPCLRLLGSERASASLLPAALHADATVSDVDAEAPSGASARARGARLDAVVSATGAPRRGTCRAAAGRRRRAARSATVAGRLARRIGGGGGSWLSTPLCIMFGFRMKPVKSISQRENRRL